MHYTKLESRFHDSAIFQKKIAMAFAILLLLFSFGSCTDLEEEDYIDTPKLSNIDQVMVGMSSERVLHLLGDPRDKMVLNDSYERWYYGEKYAIDIRDHKVQRVRLDWKEHSLSLMDNTLPNGQKVETLIRH